MLPALLVDETGDALVVPIAVVTSRDRRRRDRRFARWIKLELLQREHPGRWFFARPIFRFDARSLLTTCPGRDAGSGRLLANRWIYGWALLATVLVNMIGAVIPFYTMAVRRQRVVPNNAPRGAHLPRQW